MAVVNLLLTFSKVKDRLGVHNKNNTTDKEIWSFLQHRNQNNKVNPENVLGKISVNITSNSIFKEE